MLAAALDLVVVADVADVADVVDVVDVVDEEPALELVAPGTMVSVVMTPVVQVGLMGGHDVTV